MNKKVQSDLLPNMKGNLVKKTQEEIKSFNIRKRPSKNEMVLRL
jgi:hypothetical protein